MAPFSMAFADDVLRWIRSEISPAVYCSLSNRGDGVVIPGDAFR